jgi:hypothetical protein
MKQSVFWSRFGMISGICREVLFVVLLACGVVVFAFGAHYVIAGTTPLRIGHAVGALFPLSGWSYSKSRCDSHYRVRVVVFDEDRVVDVLKGFYVD